MAGLPGFPTRRASEAPSYAGPVTELQPAAYSVDGITPGASEKDDSLGEKYDLEQQKGEVSVAHFVPTKADVFAGEYKTWGDMTDISPGDQERYFPDEGIRVGMQQRQYVSCSPTLFRAPHLLPLSRMHRWIVAVLQN